MGKSEQVIRKAMPSAESLVTTPTQSVSGLSGCSPQPSHKDGLTRRWAIGQPLESLRQGMGDGRDVGAAGQRVPGRAGFHRTDPEPSESCGAVIYCSRMAMSKLIEWI